MSKKPLFTQFLGLNPTKLGGFEKHVLKTSEAMIAKGYRVRFVYNAEPRSVVYSARVRELGIEEEIIPEKKGKLGILTYGWHSLKSLLRNRPDVLHVHFTPYAFVLLFISWCLGIRKRFYTEHNVPYYANLFRQTLVMRSMGWFATKVFCVSDGVSKIYKDDFKMRRVETFYLGMDRLRISKDFDRDRVKDGLGVPRDCILVANVVFHKPFKGVDIFVDTVNILVNEMGRTDMRFIQMGQSFDDDFHELVMDKVRAGKLEPYLSFLGIREDIGDLLKASDIYCHTSRKEAFGLALIEASQVSLPLVCTLSGGVAEIITDGVNGYLTSMEPREIAERVAALADNAELRNTMGSKAQEMAGDRFDINKQVEKMVKNYE